MYPLIRLAQTTLRALRSEGLDVDAVCETRFRCMPWDIDIFREMNNGRVVTLYDLGRFELAIRIGLARVLRENHWGLVVAGSTVRYRRRIRVFDKVSMRTQLVGVDQRWFYLQQSMWVEHRPVSSIMLRTGVTSRGKVVDSREVMDAMGVSDWTALCSEWLSNWIRSEITRPWPP